MCVDCGARATTSDHAPVSRRDLIAAGVTDPDADRYLQARCTPCHSRRTAAVDGGFGNPIHPGAPG
jgi:5-methylcytosine-specific restriction protein A